MNDLRESGRMLARGAPAAEIHPRSRPSQESSKNDDLSESGRMLARNAPEAEIQARSRQSRESSKIDNLATCVVMPAAAGTEKQRF